MNTTPTWFPSNISSEVGTLHRVSHVHPCVWPPNRNQNKASVPLATSVDLPQKSMWLPRSSVNLGSSRPNAPKYLKACFYSFPSRLSFLSLDPLSGGTGCAGKLSEKEFLQLKPSSGTFQTQGRLLLLKPSIRYALWLTLRVKVLPQALSKSQADAGQTPALLTPSPGLLPTSFCQICLQKRKSEGVVFLPSRF